jgi:hypothetical protein
VAENAHGSLAERLDLEVEMQRRHDGSLTPLGEILAEAATLAWKVERSPIGRVPKAKVGHLLLFPVSHDLAGKKVALVSMEAA